MLLNSYLFLFLFLPVTLLGYYLIIYWRHSRMAVVWLVVASLLFYGWYNPVYLALISSSIIFNYLAGKILTILKTDSLRKSVLAFGVTVNILLLGYFKYANFFVDNVNILFQKDFHLNTIILPLGISFITLQQIAYLADIFQNKTGRHSLLDYCLFVTFFPKLISGPIVRFKEMMPQVIKDHLPRPTSENVGVGLTVLFLGLSKKVVLADGIGAYVAPIFNAAANGSALSFFNSWGGALAYTFQLYFDFSGYCDMAIGLGLLFGIRLPLNFYSPYKATSIIDFWRRWHMTLSRFLRDYLYIPLGGNRRGYPRQMVNLMVVMAIAGFWHGAGWTFVIWGTLHGLFLAINHGWRLLKRQLSWDTKKPTRLGIVVSIFFTFIAVVLAWVFFRADNVGGAVAIIKSMVGMNGFVLPSSYYDAMGPIGRFLGQIGISFAPVTGFSSSLVIWIIALLVICWFLPNVQEFMSNYKPAIDIFPGEIGTRHSKMRWEPSLLSAIVTSVIFIVAFLGLGHVSTFIYFQF
jgi:alginate O-acetyltransferase complex protein AlgI